MDLHASPSPFNPPGNRRVEGRAGLHASTSPASDLPAPRLQPKRGVVWVPAFTDLKLHDITDGPDDPNREPLDMNAPAGRAAFFAGNGRFPHAQAVGRGQRAALLPSRAVHHPARGDPRPRRRGGSVPGGVQGACRTERDAVIEFLKSLQVLPAGSPALVVDEHGKPRSWTSVGAADQRGLIA